MKRAVVAILALVLVACASPTPACDPCLGATAFAMLQATATPSRTPSPTRTLTPDVATYTATPFATPTSTPTATQLRTPISTVTPSAPELTIEFLNTAKPGSRLQSVITYQGVTAQIGLYLPAGTDLYWEDADPKPNIACGRACWDVSGSATIHANIWFNSTNKTGDVVTFELFWKTASGGDWTAPVAVRVGGGTVQPSATPLATATRTPAPAQVWTGGQWTHLNGVATGPDLEFLLMPAGDGRFWFCNESQACCVWWDATVSWGMMAVRHDSMCSGELRWVWAPNTVSVSRLAWVGAW